MTDDPTSKDSEATLILEWTDAVESWELELDGAAIAEASPLSLTSTIETLPRVAPHDEDVSDNEDTRPTPSAEMIARAVQSAGTGRVRDGHTRMYQPPTEAELAKLAEQSARVQGLTSARSRVRRTDSELRATTKLHHDSRPPPLPARKLRAAEPAAPALLLESHDLDLDDGFDDTVESERPERLEKKARIKRIEALTQRASDEQAAELLLSAAELAEELAEFAWAEQLYERARERAPRRTEPRESLARLAFRAGDLERYVDLLAEIAGLEQPAADQARALGDLALARFALRGDAAGGLEAANAALALAPERLSAALLVARIALSSSPERAEATLVPLAQRAQDLALSAMWLVTAGRALELRGERTEARALYARAAQIDPYAFDAQFSLSRVDHALGAHATSAEALLRTLENFDIGPVAEAVRRRAAHMLGREGSYQEAVELLEHASDDVSLRTAVQVAALAGDPNLYAKAVEAWTLGTNGPERALALLAKAEHLTRLGERARAEETLELAALEDPGLRLVQVARESLARDAADQRKLAEIAAGEEAGSGTLSAAAKLARRDDDAADELTWLLEAAEAEAGIVAHVLASDASAELGRLDALREMLRSQGHRGALPSRVRALLALGAVERAQQNAEGARTALRHAAELSPHAAVVLRAYARARPAPAEVARAYRDEAEGRQGVRAAFLHLRAGFALGESDAVERLEALGRAQREDPTYAPASWALQREARRQGDLACLSELHTQLAEGAADDRERAAHLVRAALIRASDDSDGAAAQLARARALVPDDPVLAELVLRLGDASPANIRVETLDRIAERLSERFRRPVLLAAAGTLEDAGRYADAEARYRSVLAIAPNDALAEAGLDRVLHEARPGPELLASRMRSALEASTERARARALEELMLLEPESASALDWANELLALEPQNALGLRMLERNAMRRGDAADLLGLVERSYDASDGPRDRAARMRLWHLLRAERPDDDGSQEAIDTRLLAHADDARESGWLSRQVSSAAIGQTKREQVVRGVELQATQTTDIAELAALSVQRGWLLLDGGSSAQPTLPRAPERGDHPTYRELRAETLRVLGQHAEAAEEFEEAARSAKSPERIAHLWARAAELWDGPLGSRARARAAYQRASEHDVGYPGVRDRLLALLNDDGDTRGLIALTVASIAKGGTGEQICELHRRLATLHEQLGQRDAAIDALRDGLAHVPDHLPIQRDLAQLLDRAERHAERIDALSAIGRLSRDPLELRDAFLELGKLHEVHVPDAAQAAAAYQRVLKIVPRNPDALERLAALYRREGKHSLAIEMLTQLAQCAATPERRRDVTLQLSAWKEEHGDPRGAEELLETLRKSTPTDGPLLRGLSELLRRTGAHTALAMHLNRAVNDLRHALSETLEQPAVWQALVDVLIDKQRIDAAGQVAAVALAIGIEAPDLKRHVQTERGVGEAALSEQLDELVYPSASPPMLRALFRHGAEALNRAAPLDLKALHAERVDKRHPLRAVVGEFARWVGGRDIELYVTPELPYAFVPVQDAPVALLIGRALLDDALSLDEQRFLTVRALKIARAQMSITCRLRPQELELLLHALVHSQHPAHAPAQIETAALEDAARRIGKLVSRRMHTDLAPHLAELSFPNELRFDGAGVYGAASTAGSRSALLALGGPSAALTALAKLSGQKAPGPELAATLTPIEEARDLIAFAIDDAYFDAKARATREAR